MAEIAPFRGILYSPRAGEPAGLLAPPYDVIGESERTELEARSPYNCVRLILPRPEPGKPDETKYAQAAALARGWLDEGVLARDAQPAIYRYHQVFDANCREVVRKGYIARVRLHRFDEGVILPHERTLAGPKVDRLKLMRALRAHEFSQIFGLYPDPARESDACFAAVEATAPFLEARTGDGVTQRLWRLTDRDAIHRLATFMATRKIYIADGHHRYETMLALREELRREVGAAGARSSVEYGTMFFCNMDDPGLVVFPTHRILHGLPEFDRTELLERARRFFAIEEQPLGTAAEIREGLRERARQGVTFALATPRSERLAYLRLRDDLRPEDAPALPTVPAVRELDVTVLHGLLFETLLGITREAQAAQTNLRYVKSWEGAREELRAPGVQGVFFMNPTKVSQVKAVSDAGEVMPQKSTFFYPKIASGLVMNPIDPAEVVDPA